LLVTAAQYPRSALQVTAVLGILVGGIAGPAAEVRSALLRLVKDAAIHREISKIDKVEGELAGRLILGERLDAIAPIVAVSKVAVSAWYEPLAHPIVIKEGAFHYSDGKFSLSGVNGTVGRSSFSALTGSVRNDEQPNLRSPRSVSLTLERASTLATSEPYQRLRRLAVGAGPDVSSYP
jgi:hypothetical protein